MNKKSEFLIEKFLKKIELISIKLHVDVDLALINNAIYYMQKYHKDQKRCSNEPYWQHPLNVALTVIDYCFDTEVIVAALLHDLVEDTNFSINQVDFLFGKEIALLVDGLTKIDTNNLKFKNKKLKLSNEESAFKLVSLDHNQKKIFIIKLCDRLDNMRTIRYIKSIEKQKAIALETMKFYIPIATYIGLKNMALELQTLAIRTLNK